MGKGGSGRKSEVETADRESGGGNRTQRGSTVVPVSPETPRPFTFASRGSQTAGEDTQGYREATARIFTRERLSGGRAHERQPATLTRLFARGRACLR